MGSEDPAPFVLAASGLTPELAVGEGVSLSHRPTARLAALAGMGAIGFGMVYTILQAHFLYH